MSEAFSVLSPPERAGIIERWDIHTSQVKETQICAIFQYTSFMFKEQVDFKKVVNAILGCASRFIAASYGFSNRQCRDGPSG